MKFTTPFQFNNTYARVLPELGQRVTPTPFPAPKWVSVSDSAAKLLGTSKKTLLEQPQWLNWFSGNELLKGTDPIAQKYTGHQFGQYNPELGDGRGLLLGEAEFHSQRFDLHVKGAGKTPYSRFGDGRAVLRSCIREFLASETLEQLGIPSSRALGLFLTGEQVQRETLEPGAALIRLCPSHLRFGHFEYAFYQQNSLLLEQLVNYTTEHVIPQDSQEMHVLNDSSTTSDKAYQMFKFTIRRTAEMVAKWQAYGFCHGVMNTDNMSILGLTFDYGPYGFLDVYDPKHICNHSDHSGRYAYEEQPSIALWNLNALGYALSPLLSKEQLTELLTGYEPTLLDNYSDLMRKKLGFTTKTKADQPLLGELLQLMQTQQRDYTHTFRTLSEVKFSENNQNTFIDTFIDREAAKTWLEKYQTRLAREIVSDEERGALMCSVNPKYLLRNHLAQEVIEAAELGDYAPLEELLAVLQNPFSNQDVDKKFSDLPPDWASTLSISCSS